MLGIKRLFIDGMSGFERAVLHPSRLVEFFAALMDRLRSFGVSTMATWGTREIASASVAAPSKDISAIFDNMILLRQVEDEHQFIRSMSVQKIRDGHFASTSCRLDFARGVLIADLPSSAETTPPPVPASDG